MSMFHRITKRDKPERLAATAARNEALLLQALTIAQRKAKRRRPIIREILASGTVEGLASRLNSKASAVMFRVPAYKRTWHSLIPWQNLVDTTPEAEAESLLFTVVDNLAMTEKNTWPKQPEGPSGAKAARPTKRSNRAKTRAPV
jgi:hypothetical protein